MAKLNVDGYVDLAKMQAEVSQFVELEELLNGKAPEESTPLEPLKLAGFCAFALTTDGDITKPDSTIATSAKLDLTDLDIRGLKTLAAAGAQSVGDGDV